MSRYLDYVCAQKKVAVCDGAETHGCDERQAMIVSVGIYDKGVCNAIIARYTTSVESGLTLLVPMLDTLGTSENNQPSAGNIKGSPFRKLLD